MALIGLAFGGVFGFWQARRGGSESETIPGTYLDSVMPGLCRMESQLASGNKTDAYNTFWNEVHLPAHALAGTLVQASLRGPATSFQQAKMVVERDLSTLAPSLSTALPAFVKETRTALVAAGRPEPSPCP